MPGRPHTEIEEMVPENRSLLDVLDRGDCAQDEKRTRRDPQASEEISSTLHERFHAGRESFVAPGRTDDVRRCLHSLVALSGFEEAFPAHGLCPALVVFLELQNRARCRPADRTDVAEFCDHLAPVEGFGVVEQSIVQLVAERYRPGESDRLVRLKNRHRLCELGDDLVSYGLNPRQTIRLTTSQIREWIPVGREVQGVEEHADPTQVGDAFEHGRIESAVVRVHDPPIRRFDHDDGVRTERRAFQVQLQRDAVRQLVELTVLEEGHVMSRTESEEGIPEAGAPEVADQDLLAGRQSPEEFQIEVVIVLMAQHDVARALGEREQFLLSGSFEQRERDPAVYVCRSAEPGIGEDPYVACFDEYAGLSEKFDRRCVERCHFATPALPVQRNTGLKGRG